MSFSKRFLACAAAALAMFGSLGPIADAAEQTLTPVPPPLSRARAAFFDRNPGEFQKLLQRLPRRPAPTQKHATPSSTPPYKAPPSGWNYTATSPIGSDGNAASGLSNPLLLTDGTVIVHVMCSTDWYKLTPNANGNYIYGTWSKIASIPASFGYNPLYFASQILSSGKVVMNGGEYNGSCQGGVWTNKGAIYDPNHDSWTNLPPPSFFTNGNIGDAQSVILANGAYMVADCCTTDQAILNENKLTWTQTGTGKADVNDEEGWALLPDGTLLTTDAYANSGCGTNSERYSPATGAWTSAGSTMTRLSDCDGNRTYEVGPIMTRPNGTVVGFSGVTTGVAGTAIFTVSSGTWASGPSLPTINGQNYNLADAPAVIIPNGNILFAASPGVFNAPTHFFVLAPTSDSTISQVGDTTNSPNMAAFQVNFLLLPTGQVLATDFSETVGIYQPVILSSSGNSPTITKVPTTLSRGQTYLVQGRQFNGVAFGSYGDDQQAGTNFPLVQITNNATGHVFFAATRNFSSRSIDLNRLSNADFYIPNNYGGRKVETGASSLVVIANGVPSASVAVTIQ